MPATLDAIRRVARDARPDLASLDNCGYINNRIAAALEEKLDVT